MDWLRLPPLNSLRAFSALAETSSYTRAAERLNVTHAAVSQQIRSLEERLGLPLVKREGRGIRLTNEGLALAAALEDGFSAIEQGILRLQETSAERPVQVTMSPAFAVEWLMPRIMEFQNANPDITLLLNPTGKVVELKQGGIDVAIRYRDRRRPNASVQPVLVTDMIIIGAPSLVAGRDLSKPEFLVDMPWLQELGTNEVAEWLTYRGVIPDRSLNINHMPGNLIMNAVRRGDGLTYTARAFFQDEIATGKMIELFSENKFATYYIEKPPGPQRPAVDTFIRWLASKAETVTR